jgi:glycerol-3-phosphate dehydrogenase
LSAADLLMLAPRLNLDRLTGGFWYRDARTDDARLVLRVIGEALASGAEALSRARVEELVHVDGQVRGVMLKDLVTGKVARLTARTVVNATGAWADRLRARVDGKPVIRPLRGSHLIFPAWRFPVAQAVALRHPHDGRPLFAYPWEGQTLLGTTDVDHEGDLDAEPTIGAAEAEYMLGAVRAAFPGLGLSLGDAISSYAGVRPVVGTGKKDPSKESREHVIWDEKGLITVTGGKLTTFRKIARDAVKAVAVHVPELAEKKEVSRFITDTRLPAAPGLDAAGVARLAGRYGSQAQGLVTAAQAGELERIPGTPFLWAELRWSARSERVVHLGDLMLRRVRAGLLLPEGGVEHLPRVRAVCQRELGWDDARWEQEEEQYLHDWKLHHGVATSGAPPRPSAPRVARPGR